jgi:zinc transport system ATP-binding protein
LLLDEPVTGLDPESSQNMYNIIKDLHENKNMTIVMVTHDVEAARNNATRILNFNELVH